MKIYLHRLTIIISILWLLLFNSCSGQNKINERNNPVISDKISENLPKLIRSQGTYSHMTHTGLHADTMVLISNIIEDKKGNIWISTSGEGIYCFDGDKFINFSVKDGLISNDIYTIFEDSKGIIWLGTTNGVSTFNGNTFTNYPFHKIKGNSSKIKTEITSTESNTEVWSLTEDKKGNLWLGTTDGVYYYDGSKFFNIQQIVSNSVTFNSTNNFRAVTDIIEDKKGNIWFTSWFDGLNRYDGSGISDFKRENIKNNDGLLLADDGNLWIGNRGNGVLKYDGKIFENLFKDMLISDMKEDGNGNIWFAAFDRKYNTGSLICYNKSTNKIESQIYIKDKTGNNNISAIAIDKSGNIWFGSDKMTLSKYDGKTFTNYFSEKPSN